MKRAIRGISIFVVVAMLFLVAFVLILRSRPPVLPPLPNPNGYDDFIAAAKGVSDPNAAPHEMSVDDLRAFIATNSESLRLARLALTRTCSVPTAEVIKNFNARMQDFVAMKRLAQLLAGEGRLAEFEGRTNDAMQCYLRTVRLGNESSHGGMVIHRLVGVACEAIGLARLLNAVTNLSPQEAQATIAELEKLDESGITWAEIMKGERAFVRHEVARNLNPIAWVRDWWGSRAAVDKAEQRHLVATARRRIITIELAVRCFQVETGHLPARLDEICPKYLKRVPTDPYTSKPLLYKAQATNWVVYSAGPNVTDDGGTRDDVLDNSR